MTAPTWIALRRTLLPRVVSRRRASGRGLNRDEFYVNLGCLRKYAQVVRI
jgi:hypothetical protein